jgi:chaperonin GroES
MNVTPTLDNILVLPLEADEKTASGIYIPDSAKEKPQKGKVISVGPGKFEHGQLIKPGVKKNQVVLFKKWGGEEITVDGKEYKLVKEEDILATIAE